MIINSINIDGLKGLRASYDFETPLVRIQGRNRSGKTTILEAVHIATVGRHTGLSPKDNTKTAAIMRGLGPEKWSIAMETDKGRANYNVSPSLITHSANGIPPLSLHPMADFMALTGPARSRALAEAAGVEKYEAELEAHKAAAQEAIEGAVFMLQGSIIDRAMAIQERLKQEARALKDVLDNIPAAFEPQEDDPDRKTLEANRARVADLEKRLAKMRNAMQIHHAGQAVGYRNVEDVRTACQKAIAHHEKLDSALAACRRKVDAKEAELSQLVELTWDPEATCATCGAKAEHWSTTEEEVAAFNDKVATKRAELSLELSTAKLECESIAGPLAAAAKAKDEMIATLAEAEAEEKILKRLEGVERVDEEEFNALQAELRDLEEAVESGDALAKQWDECRANLSAAQEVDARRGPVAAALRELNAWLKELGSRVFSDVLERGNVLTKQALGIEFAFHKGTFVWWNEGTRIPYEAMSGSERALCGLALSIGLQLRSEALIVFLDEFHVFDAKVRDKILTALEDMLMDGRLDMAFVVEPTEGDLCLA